MNYEWLKLIANKYSVISFDIFDTLLKRDVYKPKDLFGLIEHGYSSDWISTSQEVSDYPGFAEKRILAERLARDNVENREANLDDIYNCLQGFSVEETKNLKKIELAAESRIICDNPAMHSFYSWCIEQGKKVLLISDMYLPTEFIQKLLKDNRYFSYNNIYISNEHKASKSSGKLFKIVMEKENVGRHSILHIGDSKRADLLGARKAGIRSILIPRRSKNTLYGSYADKKKSLDSRTFSTFVNNHSQECSTRLSKVGFETLGPLMYGFCSFVHNVSEQVEEIWFLARDMYMFFDAYKVLYPADECKIRYLCVSRRSLRAAFMDSVDDWSDIGVLFSNKKLTAKQIIEGCGYKIEDVAEHADSSILRILADSDKLFDTAKAEESSELKTIFDIIKTLDNEYNLAQTAYEYLYQFGIEKKILVVDIGWHGTIQFMLNTIISKMCGKTAHLTGAYIGDISNTMRRKKVGKSIEYVFNLRHLRSSFGAYTLLLENLVLAPVGTTIGYKQSNEYIEPVLGIAPDQSQRSVLNDYQNGAISFIKLISTKQFNGVIAPQIEECVYGFEHLAAFPKVPEQEKFGELRYENYEEGKIAAPKPFIYYATHQTAFGRDLKKSNWRNAFLRRLLKNVPAPYNEICIRSWEKSIRSIIDE